MRNKTSCFSRSLVYYQCFLKINSENSFASDDRGVLYEIAPSLSLILYWLNFKEYLEGGGMQLVYIHPWVIIEDRFLIDIKNFDNLQHKVIVTRIFKQWLF